MLKEFIVSFNDNIREKSRNPFLGTYLIVWLIRNWKLVYAVFNFDPKHTLQYKIDFIEGYYKDVSYVCTLFENAGISIVVLLVTYFLINFSRLITNLYEKRLTPLIYKWTDSKSIVMRSLYTNLSNERDRIQKKLDDERENRIRLEEDVSRLEERIAKMEINGTNQGKPPYPPADEYTEMVSKKDLSEIIFNRLKENMEDINEYIKFGMKCTGGVAIELNEFRDINKYTDWGLANKVQRTNFAGTIRESYSLTDNGKKVLELSIKHQIMNS